MIAPLELNIEELEIYRLLYLKMDFDTFEVKYTMDQLSSDSDLRLKMTKKKVSLIIKKFIDSGMILIIKPGSKGNPTVYQLNKLEEIEKHKSNLKETQKERKGNTNETNKSSQINVFEDFEKHNRNTTETQKERKGNTKVTPINDKDKENDKENKYISEQQIFDMWNNLKAGINHKEIKPLIDTISKSIKKYKTENILTAIKRLSIAYNDKSFYYEYKWNLGNFLTQKNGIVNWLDEGQYWNSYLDKNQAKDKINEQAEVNPWGNLKKF
jgi:hypothetical protein